MKTTKMVVILVLALGLAAEVANADFFFGTPTNLGPTVNSSAYDGLTSISADGLSLFFTSDRPGRVGGRDIWVTTRETTDDDWGEPVNLGPIVNSSSHEWGASISSDGLSLYFGSYRGGGYGGADIWVTTRATIDDPWGDPVNLGPTVNSSNNDECPNISADELSLFFHSDRSGSVGGHDLWVTTRATKDDDWDTPVNLGPPINTSAAEWCSSISADGRMLFFVSGRYGGYGQVDIWVTRRATTDDDWGEPVNLGPIVNSSSYEWGVSISSDGSTLFFGAGQPIWGDGDIWQAPIIPIVDFNGDGIVDSADMCIMVDHWYTDNALYDIAPPPFGDGIVDIQDLIVLSEYLFEELNDPTLIAHWALDEIEGDIASDSANDNDGTVYGNPAWQPQGGMIDGALQLDGIDDYVNTPFVLNPAEGKFSVFVWIKGGTPGQLIISQVYGANWLSVDVSEGNLMTELNSQDSVALLSQTIITDGDWHRIGFVWDGFQRILYVNDVEVTRDVDALSGLRGSNGGFYIGAGTSREPGTFWSGLIDDIRIYNRAVRP